MKKLKKVINRITVIQVVKNNQISNWI